MDAPAFDPIEAVTAADPYPYYAHLVARRPFYRDEALNMWVATSAEAVEAVLAHPALRVRPAAEPVPEAIAGTPLGEVFAALVRWQDGTAHVRLKSAVVAATATLDRSDVVTVARIAARDLASGTDVADPRSVRTFGFSLPAYVTALLLGLSHDDAYATIAFTHDIVHALLPGATPIERSAGSAAARELRARLAALGDDATGTSLTSALLRNGNAAQIEARTIASNAIGFLIQGYDATAGLIGNTLVASARERALGDARDLEEIVTEVARFDAPVHNTRRYADRDVTLFDATVRSGETILVILAAANRDPAANPEPDRLVPGRANARTYTFGSAAHACAGMRLATAISATAVEHLIGAGLDPAPWAAPHYEPRPNARIPAP